MAKLNLATHNEINSHIIIIITIIIITIIICRIKVIIVKINTNLIIIALLIIRENNFPRRTPVLFHKSYEFLYATCTEISFEKIYLL